jgi:hypothetical protein
MRDPALKAVGKLSAERVEERIMEQYAGILRQWQPVTVEDDKVGGESSCSFAPLDCGGKTSSPWFLENKALADNLEGWVSAGKSPVATRSFWYR